MFNLNNNKNNEASKEKAEVKETATEKAVGKTTPKKNVKSNEIVKRRRAEQEVKALKSKLKTLADQLNELIK